MNLWTVHLCATQSRRSRNSTVVFAQTRVGAKTAIGATALLHNNELLCPSDNEACATDGLSYS